MEGGEMTAQVKLWDAEPGYDLNEEVDLPEMHSWFLDATHRVPPWTPMFGWFWNRYCSHGLKYCADLLSIPTCKGWEFKGKNGGGYCAFHIVRDEEEIKRREVKFREALRPWIEDFDGMWSRYKKEMLKRYEPIKAIDLDNASNCELLYHLYDLISMYRRMWEIHFQGIFFVVLPAHEPAGIDIYGNQGFGLFDDDISAAFKPYFSGEGFFNIGFDIIIIEDGFTAGV